MTSHYGDPVRTVRVPDDIWRPAVSRARAEGHTISAVTRDLLQEYAHTTPETTGADTMTGHANYPHQPGRLYDCAECEARCHCEPGSALCVFDGVHAAAGPVWALWHGGPSYAAGYVADDAERFATMADAADALRSRDANSDGRTPAVAASSLTVWLSDPSGDPDPYPDVILTLSPSGDVVSEPC